MLTNELFNTDYERRISEGAVDQLEQRRIDDLNMKMDDLARRAKEAKDPAHKAALVKDFMKCKEERDSYYKLRESGIGQDIVNKQEKMSRATPQTKAGAVASTVKNAAKWLAGKGGPGKEGPTYEGVDDAWQKEGPWTKIPKTKSGKPVDPRGEVTHLSDIARRAAERKTDQKKNYKEVDKQGVAETVVDVRSGLAKIYNKLAPKIERHRDSFLAGQLYDELENYAELHGAEDEFKRMINNARGRAHMEYDTNPGGFQNWFWFLPFGDDVEEGMYDTLGEDQDTSGVESAIIRRIMVAHVDWLQQFGPEKVMQAAEEVAYNVGDVDEIGTSDVSAYVHEVGQILGVDQLNEKWSQKYKKSINCSNPKGFSQRAHCAGRKK